MQRNANGTKTVYVGLNLDFFYIKVTLHAGIISKFKKMYSLKLK